MKITDKCIVVSYKEAHSICKNEKGKFGTCENCCFCFNGKCSVKFRARSTVDPKDWTREECSNKQVRIKIFEE